MNLENLRQELITLEAGFCAALSDPSRLLILYSLKEGLKNVSELSAELNITQPNISKHLKILKEKGLVISSKNGTQVNYDLADPRLIEAMDLLRTIMRDQLQKRSIIINHTTPL
jgi:ArsR family transcriptional regulator